MSSLRKRIQTSTLSCSCVLSLLSSILCVPSCASCFSLPVLPYAPAYGLSLRFDIQSMTHCMRLCTYPLQQRIPCIYSCFPSSCHTNNHFHEHPPVRRRELHAFRAVPQEHPAPRKHLNFREVGNIKTHTLLHGNRKQIVR